MDLEKEILDANLYDSLWYHWHHNTFLQMIRKTTVSQCMSDVDVSITWSSRRSDDASKCVDPSSEQLSTEQNLQRTLKHNIGAMVDWLSVVGVCPIAEALELDFEGESADKGMMCFVPHHSEVNVSTVLCERTGMWKFHTEWKQDIDDCLGSNITNLSTTATNKRKFNQNLNAKSDFKSRTERFNLGTFVPNDVCIIERNRVASKMLCAMPLLEQLHHLESCYTHVNLERSRPWHFLEPTASSNSQNDVTNVLQQSVRGMAPSRAAVQTSTNIMTAADEIKATQISANQTTMVGSDAIGPASSMYQVPLGFKTSAAAVPPGPNDVPCTREYLITTLSKVFLVPAHFITTLQHEHKQSSHIGAVNSNMVSFNDNKLLDYWSKIFTHFCTFILHKHCVQNEPMCQRTGATTSLVHVVRRGEHVFKPELNELMVSHVLGFISQEELESVLRRSAGLSTRVAFCENSCKWPDTLQAAVIRTIAPMYQNRLESKENPTPSTQQKMQPASH